MATVTFDEHRLFNDVWQKWAATGGPALEAAAKGFVHVETGELQDSISFSSTGSQSGELRASADHAVVHHDGHGVIVPKDPDGVLAFMNKFSGEAVFAKSVGPVAGNPYLLDAARSLGLRVG